MLNKELCKKCYKETFGWKWNRPAEQRWKKKQVMCPILKRTYSTTRLFIIIKTDENDLPKQCKYKLEHLVTGQNHNETESKDM